MRFDNPALLSVSKAKSREPAQILLRWGLQHVRLCFSPNSVLFPDSLLQMSVLFHHSCLGACGILLLASRFMPHASSYCFCLLPLSSWILTYASCLLRLASSPLHPATCLSQWSLFPLSNALAQRLKISAQGFVIIPKSVSQKRIVSNAQIFDFELDQSEMKELDGLDEYLVSVLLSIIWNKYRE